MSARFRPLDRLRAVAVVLMVQGHTFTALLAPDALPLEVLNVHALLHGLTAPMFLFGAGFAFAVASYPRYQAFRSQPALVLARLRRYALLLALGYGLQLPGASLSAALRLDEAELVPVLRVGPLHLMALCMTFCQLSIFLARSPTAHALGMLAAATTMAALAPWVYGSQLGTAFGPLLGAWLDASRGSLFPLFPWASFALFGVAVGARAVRRPIGMHHFLLSGSLLAATSYALFRFGVRLAAPLWFWHASPLYVLFRIGLVACLLGLFHLGTRATTPSRLGVTLAQHSLVAYVTHLLVLYGTPFTPNLAHRFERTLGLVETSVACAGIMLLTLLATFAWAALARAERPARGIVQAALTLLGLTVLLR